MSGPKKNFKSSDCQLFDDTSNFCFWFNFKTFHEFYYVIAFTATTAYFVN